MNENDTNHSMSYQNSNKPVKKGVNTFLVILVVVLVCAVGSLFYLVIIGNNKKDNNTNDNDTTEVQDREKLNKELSDTYGFTMTGYTGKILALNNDGITFEIANASGLGLKLVWDYAYDNGKFYLLSRTTTGNMSIYSIDLTKGNGKYYLEKVYSIKHLDVNDNNAETDKVEVFNNVIYFNDNTFGVSKYNISTKTYKNIKTFNHQYVTFVLDKTNKYLYYLGGNEKSGVEYINQPADIYKYSITNGTAKKIANDILGRYSLALNNNELIYASRSTDGFDFYSYNLSDKTTKNLIKNVSELIPYNNSYIYVDFVKQGNLNSPKVVKMLNSDKTTKILYNCTEGFIIDGIEMTSKNTLQVAESNTVNSKYININLSTNKQTTVSQAYEKVVFIK